ncbi:hypothetical protein COB55_04325 [Candidatus Wolfebacteria bacterium]|nr:MAG: hypothetical protein COB55_04325 [Candidatus Wolfebacteria bacterium]
MVHIKKASILIAIWIALFGVLFAGVIAVSDFAGVNYLFSEDVNDPIKITIPVIGVDTTIENPIENDIATLDSALKEGAVRHPDSVRLGERGRMFVFGHSSSLTVVHNQNYRALNGLGDLKVGDSIFVESSEKEYEYIVDDVRLVDASEEYVTLEDTGYSLTLSTCNSFGATQERFVVEAHRI